MAKTRDKVVKNGPRPAKLTYLFSCLLFYVSICLSSTYTFISFNSGLIAQKKIKVVVFGLEISRNIFVSNICRLVLFFKLSIYKTKAYKNI